jgi:hypothetical protein
MIKHTCYLLLILVFLSCNSKEHSANNNDTILQNGNETASLSYPGFLKQVAIKGASLKMRQPIRQAIIFSRFSITAYPITGPALPGILTAQRAFRGKEILPAVIS